MRVYVVMRFHRDSISLIPVVDKVFLRESEADRYVAKDGGRCVMASHVYSMTTDGKCVRWSIEKGEGVGDE